MNEMVNVAFPPEVNNALFKILARLPPFSRPALAAGEQ